MARVSCACVLALFGHFAAACGDDPASARPDGSLPVDGGARPERFTPTPPAPPTPPALPSMAPCPDGWREVADPDGATLCEPWPEAGRASCPDFEMHVPGTPGCAPVGASCPTGEWPEDLPTDRRVIYVRVGASGGNGNRDTPYGTVNEALAVAFAGNVIALAKGTYPAIRTNASVEIVGACAAETLVPATSGFPLLITGGTPTVRNLTFGPSRSSAVVLGGAATVLRMEGVVVMGAREVAIIADESGTAELDDVLVDDPEPGSSVYGRAVMAQGGSRINVRRSVFRGTRDFAARAVLGGTVDLEEVAVVDGRSFTTLGAPGPSVADDATLSGRWVVIEGMSHVALGNEGYFGTLDFDGLIVRNTGPDDRGRMGWGVNLEAGGTARLSHALVERQREAGIKIGTHAMTDAATLTGSDVIVRDTQATEATGENGVGILVDQGSTLGLERVLVARNVRAGMSVQTGSDATLADLTITDTAEAETGGEGAGLLVAGAFATLDRVAILRSAGAGLQVQQESRVDARDLAIDEITGRSDLTGRGFGVTGGAELTAERMRVTGTLTGHGMILDGSSAEIMDLFTRDARGRGDDAEGYGVVAQRSVFRLTRADIEGQRYFGILIQGGADPAVLTDVRIAGTREGNCVDCTDRSFGHGLIVERGSIEARRFALLDHSTCGLLILNMPGIDIRTGVVAQNAIGACLPDESYDLAALQNDVLYEDNGTNLDASNLPVPTFGTDL